MAVLGANAYWLLGRCFTGRPRWRSRSWVREAEPVVDAASARGAIEYSDYVLVDNDARFVTQLLLDAEQRGAVISNYTELVGAERAGGTWAMQVRDHASGAQLGLKATVVVNAAGPYLDDVGELVRTTTTKRLVLSKGIHLVVPRITGSGRVLAFHDDTDRLFYVIPMGHRSAIGTTDTRTEDPDEPVTDDDRQYLLAQINRRLRLAEPLGVDDVIAERVGVRPLVVDSPAEIDDQDWTALSRRHHLEIDEQRGVISILGGKLSDCLNVGEEVVAAARRVGIEGPRPLTGTWLGEAGARDRQRFRHDAVAAGLGWPPRYEDEATYADVLWRRYGNRARQVLEIVVAEPSLGASLMELADCSEAEIVHLRQAERIVTIDDFLRRRTPLAQLNRPGDLAADRGVRRAVEVLLGERGLGELGQAPDGFHPEER
jgi:glycerol-3-phosphate dehydrogenase